MARTVAGSKRVTIDPLKHSPALGGVLAFLGLAGCMPLLHGGQGCSAFVKALLTRHFREPIPVQTTALTEVSTVLGPADSLRTAISAITRQHRPEVIGVLTTAIPEVCGDDLAGALATIPTGRSGPLVIAARTPDFDGGLSDGWSAALMAIVAAALRQAEHPGDGDLAADLAPNPGDGDLAAYPAAYPGDGDPAADLVAVPTGAALTAADLDELGDLVRAFGLRPILVPDLSRSLDGHLGQRWTSLTTGGTTRAELRHLATARTVLAVGASSAGAALALAAGSAADLVVHGHGGGLAASDAIVADLVQRSGRPMPQAVRRWRARLADGLLDSHLTLGGTRVAIAGEPEFLAGVDALLAEAGAEVVAAVTPTRSDVLDAVSCPEVVVGDLVDLEERAAEGGAELIVASANARDLARRLGVAHLVAGFPVPDRLGAQLRGSFGYRGSLHLLFEAANRLLDHREERSNR